MESESNLGEKMFSETPPKLKGTTEETVNKRVPDKSKLIYETAYNSFIKWADDKKVKKFSETVLLAYFTDLSKVHKSSTLWSKFSMLKNQLLIKNYINIQKYRKLIAFIKETNIGYKPKKSEVFTKEQFDYFIDYAPDKDYLAAKVVLIIGVSGSCRCEELTNITVDDIQEVGNVVFITICDSKTNASRSFAIVGEKYVNLYKTYAALRPSSMNYITNRFFVRYCDGRCTRAVMGVNTIGSISQKVASFLQLPNVKDYTGHCFRRTSATFIVDRGGDIRALKRRVRKSNAEVNKLEDIEQSLTNKNEDIEACEILGEPGPSSCKRQGSLDYEEKSGGNISSPYSFTNQYEELRLKSNEEGEIHLGCPAEHRTLEDELIRKERQINELQMKLHQALSTNASNHEKNILEDRMRVTFNEKLSQLIDLCEKPDSESAAVLKEMKSLIFEFKAEFIKEEQGLTRFGENNYCRSISGISLERVKMEVDEEVSTPCGGSSGTDQSRNFGE